MFDYIEFLDWIKAFFIVIIAMAFIVYIGALPETTTYNQLSGSHENPYSYAWKKTVTHYKYQNIRDAQIYMMKMEALNEN